jgi:hypothetical protein
VKAPSSKASPEPREVVRALLEAEHLTISERGRHLLMELLMDSHPAGLRTQDTQLRATLGHHYRPTLLVSWYSQENLGRRLGWGNSRPPKSGASESKRTPEERLRRSRAKAVKRYEQELESLGVLKVWRNKGLSQRADRRPHLYGLDLEAMLQLTTPQERRVVDTEEIPNDPPEVTGRDDLRPPTGDSYDPPRVGGKEREEERTLSQERASGLDSAKAEPAGVDILREMLRALEESGVVGTTPQLREAAEYLVARGAQPDLVRRWSEGWRAMGRTHDLGPNGLRTHWPAIESRLLQEQESESRALEVRAARAGLCSCGGPLWLDPPEGREHEGARRCSETHARAPRVKSVAPLAASLPAYR